MITYPLPSLTLEEAKRLQFRAVDAVTRHFDGYEVLGLGDLGVHKGINKPAYTEKAARAAAELFGAEAALFVRGAGTGALRWAFCAMLRPGGGLLAHTAPVYPTTRMTLDSMGINVLRADFNQTEHMERAIAENRGAVKAVLVQHTRQAIGDSYDFGAVVRFFKSRMPEIPVVTDDNYAALKVPEIGCQAGADLSAFSCYKLLGPEGVGLIVGRKEYVSRAEAFQYSGGSQVQGFEAMEALRGMIYAPVALALQAQVGEELAARLSAGEIPEVRSAFLANAQSKVLLVEFREEIAADLLELTPRYGAAAHPVGSESKYEFAPMIYRVSGTFREADPSLERRMVRINPMRSGPDTIIRILRSALAELRRQREITSDVSE